MALICMLNSMHSIDYRRSWRLLYVVPRRSTPRRRQTPTQAALWTRRPAPILQKRSRGPHTHTPRGACVRKAASLDRVAVGTGRAAGQSRCLPRCTCLYVLGCMYFWSCTVTAQYSLPWFLSPFLHARETDGEDRELRWAYRKQRLVGDGPRAYVGCWGGRSIGASEMRCRR